MEKTQPPLTEKSEYKHRDESMKLALFGISEESSL